MRCAQGRVLERREPIEERGDPAGPGPGQQQRERHPDGPGDEPPARRRLAHDPEHERRRSRRPAASPRPALEQIDQEYGGVVRLKPKRCSEHERPPDGKRQRGQAHRATRRSTWSRAGRDGIRASDRRGELDRAPRYRRPASGPAGRSHRRPVRAGRSAAARPCNRPPSRAPLRLTASAKPGGTASRCAAT